MRPKASMYSCWLVLVAWMFHWSGLFSPLELAAMSSALPECLFTKRNHWPSLVVPVVYTSHCCQVDAVSYACITMGASLSSLSTARHWVCWLSV